MDFKNVAVDFVNFFAAQEFHVVLLREVGRWLEERPGRCRDNARHRARIADIAVEDCGAARAFSYSWPLLERTAWYVAIVFAGGFSIGAEFLERTVRR